MNAVVACEFIFLRWNRYVFGKDFALRLFTGEHLCPAGQMVDEVTAASSRRERPLLPSSDERRTEQREGEMQIIIMTIKRKKFSRSRFVCLF